MPTDTRRDQPPGQQQWPLDLIDEEIAHLQADGFLGGEKGFHDAEQLWRQQRQD